MLTTNTLYLPPIYLDFECFTGTSYTLRSHTTVEYVKSKRFFVQCMAYADPVTGESGVVWHDDPCPEGYASAIAYKLDQLVQHDPLLGTVKRTLVCHNTVFDGFVLSEHYDIWFEQYACTRSMAQTLLRHRSAGFSLNAVHEYLTGVKGKLDGFDIMDYKNNRLIDDSEDRKKVTDYAMQDVVALIAVFGAMSVDLPAGEWWHMDWAMQQMIDPQFVIDEAELDAFFDTVMKQIEKEFADYGVDRKVFSSNKQFAKFLNERFKMMDPLMLSVDNPRQPGLQAHMIARYATSNGDTAKKSIPIKKNPKGQYAYAFARTDIMFKTRILESDDPKLREAGRLRMLATSSQEESQAKRLRALNGLMPDNLIPMAVNHSGTHTHRLSAAGTTCGINVLAIKRGSPMRRVLRAREGYKVFSLDMSAFELCICRWLVQDAPSMKELIKHNADLYSVFAAEIFNVDRDKVTFEQRQVGKTSELQLQYQSGAKTLLHKLLVSGAKDFDLGDAEDVVHKFRKQAHPMMYRYWQYCQNTVLSRMCHDTDVYELKYAPFIQYTKGKIILPDGNEMHYPNLRKSAGNYIYDTYKGPNAAQGEIYGGNLMQHCCQALAAVIIKEKKRAVSEAMGWRCAHEVYDDLTFIVPDTTEHLAFQKACDIVCASLDWWPELPLSCEWGVGVSWGGVEKDNKVYGWAA